MRLRSLYGTAAAIVAATSLFAGQEGALRVTVFKPDRTPLAGVTIRATVSVSSPTQINSAIIAKTDAQGIATFWKLTPGVFTIQVEVEGYDAGAIRTDVQADKISHLQVLLRPLPAIEVGIEETFDTLDPTSATTGINVKSEMLASIPTGVAARVADIALLAPGVIQDPVLAVMGAQRSQASDPSLAVSMNRHKSGMAVFSTNNYLIDGIDVSNPLNGRNGVNVMHELIGDVDIKTGGVSAEYQAKNGIFYNVTTIAGSNEWHGGLTASFAPSSLEAGPKEGRFHSPGSFQSTGFYTSGPIVKSKVWLVAAAQGIRDRGTLTLPEGAAAYPGESRSFTGNDEKNLFGKLTWQVSPSSRLIGMYHSNRRTGDYADSPLLTTAWTSNFESGGDRSLIWYSFQEPWLIADIKFGRDYQRRNLTPAQGGDFQLQVFSLTPLTAGESERGSQSGVQRMHTSRSDFRTDFLLPFTSGPVRHTLKFGYESANSEYFQDIAQRHPYYQDVNEPLMFADVVFNTLTFLPYFVDPLLYQINTNPAYSNIRTTLAGPGGTVGFDEIAGYTFDERNPKNPSSFMVIRSATTLASNPSIVKSKLSGFYIQDYMTAGNFTFSPGFRLDGYSIQNDQGATVFQQKSLFAPRVSLSWDVFGDSKAKAYAYFGRYFNPPQGVVIQGLGLTKTTGQNIEARILGQWVNLYDSPAEDPSYATVFADSARMPYTDEVRFGYEHVLRGAGTVHTLAAAATYRKDKNILQNVDAYSYTDPEYLEFLARSYFNITAPAGSLTAKESQVINAVRGLAMPVSAFAGGGRSGEENMNLFVPVFMNTPSAERVFKSVDLSYRAESSKTIFFASFSKVSAEGNSMETGDLSASSYYPFMDPRLPWMRGKLDGSVDWMFKVFGSYRFASNTTIGLFGRMDSGYHYTPSVDSSGSLVFDVPMDVNQLDDFRPGQKMTPKRVNFDLHLEQRFNLTKRVELSLGADIYNVFNNQNGTALAEGANVRAGVAPDRPFIYNPPRTIAVSAKLKF